MLNTSNAQCNMETNPTAHISRNLHAPCLLHAMIPVDLSFVKACVKQLQFSGQSQLSGKQVDHKHANQQRPENSVNMLCPTWSGHTISAGWEKSVSRQSAELLGVCERFSLYSPVQWERALLRPPPPPPPPPFHCDYICFPVIVTRPCSALRICVVQPCRLTLLAAGDMPRHCWESPHCTWNWDKKHSNM